MELLSQLALPTHNPIDGFDLTNNPGLVKSKQLAGLELWSPSCSTESKTHVRNKRSFEESFGQHSLKTFPLLVWSGQPNEEGDRSGKMHKTIHTSNKEREEENHLVGWPPIKSWRKKELHQQPNPAGGQQIRNDRVHVNKSQSRGANTLYVNVNMEGVAIGRKIDLRLYDSYQTLTNTLISMFAKYQNIEEDDGASYTLTFQNEQGDWMLAGDVPWQGLRSLSGLERKLPENTRQNDVKYLKLNLDSLQLLDGAAAILHMNAGWCRQPWYGKQATILAGQLQGIQIA